MIVDVRIEVVVPLGHDVQGTVTVAVEILVLQVEVTVVIPASHVVQGMITVVRKGDVGIELILDEVVDDVLCGAICVLLDESEEVVSWITALTSEAVLSIVMGVMLAGLVNIGTVVVNIVVKIVVFMV